MDRRGPRNPCDRVPALIRAEAARHRSRRRSRRVAPVCRPESSGRLARPVRAARAGRGSRSCAMPKTSMSMSLDGRPRRRSRTHPPTTSARPPASVTARATRRAISTEASRSGTRKLSFARTQKGPGGRLALSLLSMLDVNDGCFVLTRRGDRRRAAFARPATIRIQQSAAAFCPSADPTPASRIRTRCTGATCAHPRSAGVRHVRGDHRGIAEPCR